MREIPNWHAEFQKALRNIMMLYCLSPKDLLPFLTATLCGQFALAELSEEKVKATLDRMFNKYKEHKERMEKENE